MSKYVRNADAKLLKLGEQLAKASIDWEKACTGKTMEAEADSFKWSKEAFRIGKKIFAMRAHTIAGSLVKVRAFDQLATPPKEIDYDVFGDDGIKPVASLVTDIKMMARST